MRRVYIWCKHVHNSVQNYYFFMCIQLRLLCSIPFGECLYTVRVNTPLTTAFRLVSSRKTIRCFILCHRLLIRRLDIFVTGLALYMYTIFPCFPCFPNVDCEFPVNTQSARAIVRAWGRFYILCVIDDYAVFYMQQYGSGWKNGWPETAAGKMETALLH